MPHQEETSADQLKVNTEYYRKLNQQLIQKDNIIKLLQLKLKNLETDRARDGAAAGDGVVLEESDAEKKGKSKKSRAERDADAERISELTAKVADLERVREGLVQDLARAREEVDARDRTIAELKSRPSGVDVAQLNRELDKVKGQLAERVREAEELKAQVGQMQTQERWPTNDDPILKDELTRAEQELSLARAEVEKLRVEVATVTQRHAELETTARSVANSEWAPVVPAIIGLLQRMRELEPHLAQVADPAARAFKGQLEQLARTAGVERIRTVGAPFDVKLHQAVEMVYSSQHPHSTVLSEISTGYSARGAVVRLADVAVTLHPLHCPACNKVAAEGSRFCPSCGGRVLGREKEGVRVLDDRASLLSHLELAGAAEVAGEWPDARTHYVRVLSFDENCVAAVFGMVRVAEAEGQYEEALTYLDRAVQLDAENGETIRLRGRIQAKLEIVGRLKTLV
ncbi:MAG: nucleotide exchange factor GrpE [Candidatus Riflebacteria bacterium]|nr:nucleotide exchange factor GrpE [Candidatus Riflebacteria bacterium]